MTKHLPDETTKLPIGFEDTDRLIAEPLNLFDGSTLGICNTHVAKKVSPLTGVTNKSVVIKPKTKVHALRSRLGKALHKLYNLEPEGSTDKPLNIDLSVDLYQMENY